jgi:cytochrome c553
VTPPLRGNVAHRHKASDTLEGKPDRARLGAGRRAWDRACRARAWAGASAAPASAPAARRPASGRRCAPALLLAALLAASSASAQDETIPGFKQLDSIDARVQGCVTCHGRSGEGSGDGRFPRIAGKPAGYLYNQLLAFRDGTRRYTPMNYLMAYLPDAYLREIADHFSRQRPPFAATEAGAADPATLGRGRDLVLSGDAARGVPECVACHGTRLTGMEPGIPGLVGLRPTYIVAQLTRWRVGERSAAEPDCMKRIATRLSERDVVSIAAWLARQPAPANAAPDSPNLVRMPLACGSQR